MEIDFAAEDAFPSLADAAKIPDYDDESKLIGSAADSLFAAEISTYIKQSCSLVRNNLQNTLNGVIIGTKPNKKKSFWGPFFAQIY